MAIYPQVLSAPLDLAAAGTREVVAAPAAGSLVVIHGLYLAFAANATCKIIESTPADLSGTMTFLVTGNNVLHWPLMSGDVEYVRGVDNKAIQATLVGAGGDADGTVWYSIQEA